MNKELLIKNLDLLNIAITDEQILKLEKFENLLIETNKQFNLTAITDSDSVAVKHFADSLAVLSAADFTAGKMVLDVGTGAGFPGIPIIIARPQIKLTMLDSTEKKLKFVSSTVSALDLNANVLHMRAEEAGQNSEYREKFDIVVSRAVAALNVLSEYCLPFVKKGGVFIAMKGAKANEEIENAKNAISILGGEIVDIKSFYLSDEAQRNVIIIKKIKETGKNYPRVGAKISKKPL